MLVLAVYINIFSIIYMHKIKIFKIKYNPRQKSSEKSKEENTRV